MAKELLSTADFNNKLGKLVSSKTHLDQDLQNLIEDALLQASHPDMGGNGSCNKLDHIVTSLAGQRSWPINAIRKYIAEHTTAVWGELKDGRKGYSYKGNSPAVTMPTETWWEHKASNGNGTAGLNIKVESRLNALLRDSKKDGASVDDQELLDKLIDTYKQHKSDKKVA